MALSFTRDAEHFEILERVPVLPLRDVVVFPHMVVPLLVGRSGSLAAVDAAAGQDKWIFLIAQRGADIQEPVSADLFRIGVVGRVIQVTRMHNGTTKALVEGIARARVTRYAPAEKLLRAVLAPAPLVPAVSEADEEAMIRRVTALFEEYVGLHRRLPAELVNFVQDVESEEKRAYAIAAHLLVGLTSRQRLLESGSLAELWTEIAGVLQSEVEILRLERKIENDVRGSLFQNQREFYLQEQLKAIHKELGQDDGDDFAELEVAIARKALPEPVKGRADRELRKLRRTSPLSPESTVGRNYLDWIVALPWTERTDDVVDIARAQQVLDEDHFGLDEVKDRILDLIAVLGLVGRTDGPVICLVGPPGVGKTSLGRSIARALGRRFARMSLGGVRDEAEIRGHRRTYIGSLPGRVIQAMRKAEVVNPVILLDEVDKMGQDYRGDPASALLEVLDPAQNSAFSDHYLEVDYDLSQVVFITTANSLAQIPEPLRDRMETIRLPGYLDHEKHAIARQFLIPRQLRQHGIDPATVTWEPDVIQTITRRYTREAGVRELERRIARLSRKLARRIASRSLAPAEVTAEGSPAPKLTVRSSELRELLGVAPFDPDEWLLEDKVGVATGLAYTQVGGELLEIEVSTVAGRGKLQLTGTLGDVMKESASAAVSYARARAKQLGIERDFYRTRDIHIHIPAGATPKDGPSGGIAIAAAVVSALTGVPIRGDVAMTGELTLRGRVLPIGGLKEKSVAALRSGVTNIVLPAGNMRDVEELPADVRAAIRFHPVSSMDDVLGFVLRARRAIVAETAAIAH